jgi:anti-anti-sigma factor
MATFEIGDGRLKVTGALDPDSEEELKDACRRLLSSAGETVTLDMTQVERINSVSIGILVALLMDLQQANRRAVLQPSANLKRILDMTGLTETFARASRAAPKPRARSRKAQF